MKKTITLPLRQKILVVAEHPRFPGRYYVIGALLPSEMGNRSTDRQSVGVDWLDERSDAHEILIIQQEKE